MAYAFGPNYTKGWEAFDPVDAAASLARARMASEQRVGACAATANACSGWAARQRPRSSVKQLTLASTRADVPIRASCACRLDVSGPCCD